MKNRITTLGIAGLLVLLAGLALPPRAAAGGDPHAIAAEAFELRMAGQVDEAVKILEGALADAPAAGILHYELARTRLLLLDIGGMHDEAVAAVDHTPDNGEFRYFATMAAAYALIDAAHHGDNERMKELGRECLDQLHTLLAAEPDNHKARFMLVQLSVDMAPDLGLEVEDPEVHVASLEKEDPILGAKARCCLVDEPRQRELWRKILTDHPDDCRALSEAAAGLIQAGDLELAQKCLDEAIARDGKETYGLLGLGLAYFMREDWERAIELTQRYLDTDPPVALKAYATERLGMIHRRMGDQDRARELRALAREIDPHVWPTVMPPPEEIFTPL
jgi:tetratricopeptide (TPR) repeat protein